MSTWKRLDLASKWSRPDSEQLVALRLAPTNAASTLYCSEKYDIGMFKKDPQTGRKLWWHGVRGTKDPIRMKKHYEIWWSPVQEFGGAL